MALPISKDYLLTQLRNFKSAILDPAYTIQKSALPTASSANEGAIFQYIGSDSTNYTIGGFYQCQEVTPATDPKTYHWVEVSGGPDDNFVGTLAQWNALPLAEQIKYKTADITDDFNGSPVDSALSDTSTNPVQNKVITEALEKREVCVLTLSAVSSLPQTITNADIENDMVVVNAALGNVSSQLSDWSVAAGSGTLTISGTINGTTDVTLYLEKSNKEPVNGVTNSVIKNHSLYDKFTVGINSVTSYLEFFDLIVAYAKAHSGLYINLQATWSGHIVCIVTGISWGNGAFVLLKIIPQQANYNGIIIADDTSGSTKYYKAQTTPIN